MLRAPLVYLSHQKTFQHLIMGHAYSRRFALRFVAGDTLDDAIAVVRALNQSNIAATLDHLGENVDDSATAQRAAASYITALRRIGAEGVDSNVSLKLTQMGMDVSPGICLRNVRAILDTAAEMGRFVRIDMEDSGHVAQTISFYEELRALGYTNVGVVIQSYLYRSAGHVEKLNAMGARVRLVKGAYNEPATEAYPHKRDVDANYLRLATALLLHGNYPAIATHDERIIDWTKRFAAEHNLARDRFEFQLLYGIRRDLQQQLAAEGYRVRVYVPYGSEWYAYLMRRIAERPANLAFVLANLFRG
ncbi:MAG: proline dehydrogenase family protein [Chloroflexota bacterium]